MKTIVKRNGEKEEFNFSKIEKAVRAAFDSAKSKIVDEETIQICLNVIKDTIKVKDASTVEDIQNIVEDSLMCCGHYSTARAYILYREKHNENRRIINKHVSFIEQYKKEAVPANATVDDNANVKSRSVANMNAEIKKEENIIINRGIVVNKLRELFPDFNAKQYIQDLENRIIYKHDESTSNSGPTLPYCASSTLYPFLLNGIKDLGGLSAAPKNLDSFCGMFCNLVFTEAGQFLGATAFPEALLYFTYFCKKEWGEDFWKSPDKEISVNTIRKKTIRSQIHQY